MEIKEYFKDRKDLIIIKKLNKDIKYCKTYEDFYNSFIKSYAEEMYKHKGSLISLCNVLLKYTSDPSNSIYWIRKFESGGSDVNDNRRGAVTKVKCKDGKYCTYVYISNFDAQEIYNMILNNVDFRDFGDLISNFEYKIHFSNGCKEKAVTKYAMLEDARSLGVLNGAGLYLAHIVDTNGKLNGDNNYDFEKGEIEHWTKEIEKVRQEKIDKYNQSELAEILKAKFLRFVCPFNWFITPGWENEVNAIYGKRKKAIGEYPSFIRYVQKKIYIDFIKDDEDLCDLYNKFEDSIMISDDEKAENITLKSMDVNILYGLKTGEGYKVSSYIEKYVNSTVDLPKLFSDYISNSNSKIVISVNGSSFDWNPVVDVGNYDDFLKKLKDRLNKIIKDEDEDSISVSIELKTCKKSTTKIGKTGKSYTSSATGKSSDEDKLNVLKEYLYDGLSLIKIEDKVFHTNNHGTKAKKILNTFGVDTSTSSSCKGLLKKSNIDDEIAKASGDFKTVLEKIKKRWPKI